jgi:site-specific DNA recombinase
VAATTRQHKGTRAASYARRSRDPNKIRASTKAQLERNRRAATAEGISITREYVDDDLGASETNIGGRPDFNDLVRDIQAGRWDAVVVWAKERLHRTLTEFETLTAAAIRAGVQFLIDGKWFNPADIDDWFMHGLGTLLSAVEAKRIQQRFADGRLTAAGLGKPHGMIAYGYRRIWTVDDRSGERRYLREEIEPDEAAIVEEGCRRVLAGESLRAICLDFDARGIPPPRPSRWTPARLRKLAAEPGADPRLARAVRKRLLAGDTERAVCRDLAAQKVPVPWPAQWSPAQLRQLLLRDRNVGDRIYHGTVHTTQAWPAILDRDDLDALRALFADPVRHTAIHGSIRHLLSGIMLCGACDRPVRTVKARKLVRSTGQVRTWRIYQCNRGHLSRKQDMVDAWVTAVTVELLASKEFAAALADRAAARPDTRTLREQVKTLRTRLDRAADQCADGEIDDMQLARITGRIRPKLAAAQQRLTESHGQPLLEQVAGPDAATTWEGLTLEQRRSIVAGCWTIRITPVGSGTMPRWPAPGKPMRGVEMTPRF